VTKLETILDTKTFLDSKLISIIVKWFLNWSLISNKSFCTPRLSSTKTSETSAYFLQFYPRSVLCWKKFTQALSYVVCTQLRRHVHKKIIIRRYGEEKPWRFVFRKPVLFTLGLGLTTPYTLGILVWSFYQTFVIVSIDF